MQTHLQSNCLVTCREQPPPVCRPGWTDRCWHQDRPHSLSCRPLGRTGTWGCWKASKNLHWYVTYRPFLGPWLMDPGRCSELEISLFLLRRLLGVKTEDKKQTKVAKLVKNELLLINIGSTSTGGRVLSVKADLAKIQLTSPACTEIGEKVALSRRIEKHWRLVGEDLAWPAVRTLLTLLFTGWGSVQRGTVLEVD